MPEPLPADELTVRVRALVAAPWRRFTPWIHLAVDAGLLGTIALLAATGYPAPRIAAVAGVALAWVALHAADLALLRRAPDDAEAGAARASRLEWAMLATGFVAVAATGGLGSPLLPGALAALPLAYFQRGWSGRTRAQWAATGLGAAAVALLPAAWAGPPVAPWLYALLVAGSVGVVAGATALFLVLLTRVAHGSLREAREAREALAAQAVARARELEQLGAQLSHELRNPLSAIKTLVQLAARDAAGPAARERLEVIEAEVRRMEQVLQDYLSFARPLEKLRPEALRLGGVAGEVAALLAGRAAEAKVALRVQGDAGVVGDPLRLREAIINLVANALEASPAGAEVAVEIAEADGAARLSVRDAGRGMPAEVLERLGTPFFTTREEGTGLGVALARAAVERHGGTLVYRSREGEGTTATVTLPARPEGRRDGPRAGGR